MDDLVSAPTTPKQVQRVTQTVEVMRLRFEEPELTVDEACDRVGISRRVFYHWLHRGDDVIDNMRDFILGEHRKMLLAISTARLSAVELLIKDALHENTSTQDRVAAMRYLDPIREELERAHHAAPGVEEEAHAFLKLGPKLEKQQSRLASIEVREEDDSVVFDIYKTQDVIDITPEDAEEPE